MIMIILNSLGVCACAMLNTTNRKYCGVTVYIPLDLRRYPRYRNHSDHPIIRFPRALCANWGSLSLRQSLYLSLKTPLQDSVERLRRQSSPSKVRRARVIDRSRARRSEGEVCVWTQFSFPALTLIPEEDGLLPWATGRLAAATGWARSAWSSSNGSPWWWVSTKPWSSIATENAQAKACARTPSLAYGPWRASYLFCCMGYGWREDLGGLTWISCINLHGVSFY